MLGQQSFDTVKDAGFKSVRLPVTWADHFIGSSPDWTVDPTSSGIASSVFPRFQPGFRLDTKSAAEIALNVPVHTAQSQPPILCLI
jgi:hypothetical protein